MANVRITELPADALTEDDVLVFVDTATNVTKQGTVADLLKLSMVYVKAASALSKGDVVYASGAVGNSGAIEVSKYIANNTIDEIYVLGVVIDNMNIGDLGYVTFAGKLSGVSTDGSAVGETWADGTVLYASDTSAGTFTSTKPIAPNQAITVAMVINAHASNGTLYVRPTTGFHLNELHDVEVTGTPTTGDVLTWKGTRWEPDVVAGGSSDHNTLTGLQGGTTNEYYHLTAAELAAMVTASSTTTLTNKTLQHANFTQGYTEPYFALTSAATVALSESNGSVQYLSMLQNITFTDNLSDGGSITLILYAYSNTATWPTMTWVNNGGVAPTLNTSGYTTIILWKLSTVLFGALVGDGT